MSNYNFTSLSPIDFEALTRDLLQAELKITFESFSIGADQGIDFRYAPSTDHTIIVQCKHYIKTPFRKLLSDLKKIERPKIDRLKPARYIFVTSQELTTGKKNDLFNILKPHVKKIGDIYGREDLNNLLGKHSQIERQHFKLWFTSTAILEELLNQRTKNLSRQTAERLQRRAPLFVHHDGFKHALQILEQHHTCIIAGIPGIGKTTLAEILLLHYLEKNYELVTITTDITEAHNLGPSPRPRIYYYDDFLGATGRTDKLGKNEDQQLLEFIASIKNRHNDRLIMTTREYILNQTQLRHEKISRANLNIQTCTIDLGTYTRWHRAEILFNHLYFSKLPDLYKQAILTDKNFLKIIDHANYNPRVIETMTDALGLETISPTEYIPQFLATLNNPENLWQHTFDNQLSFEARNLLLVLRTFTTNVLLADCEEAFIEFHKHQAIEYRQATNPSDFRNALREIEGTFITINLSSENQIISFQNASIRDFLTNHLKSHYIEYKALLTNVIFFDQLILLWHLNDNKSKNECQNLFVKAAQRTLGQRPTRLHKIMYLADGELRQVLEPDPFETRIYFLLQLSSELEADELTKLVRSSISTVMNRIKNSLADRRELVDLLIALDQQNLCKDRAKYKQELDMLIPEAAIFLKTNICQMEEYEPLIDFMERWLDRYTDQDREEVIKDIRAFSTEIRMDLSGEADALGAEAEALRTIGKKLNVNFDCEIEGLYSDMPDDLHNTPESNHKQTSGSRDVSNTEISVLFDLLEK